MTTISSPAFLQAEIEAWSPQPAWAAVEPGEQATLDPADRDGLDYPARRFVRDLGSIIDAKDSMTRRQWTSLLEAIVRLAAVAHVTWLCDVHARSWDCIKAALDGNGPATRRQRAWQSTPRRSSSCPMAIGRFPASRIARRLSYRRGSASMRHLWALAGCTGVEIASISSAASIADVCNRLRAQCCRGGSDRYPGRAGRRLRARDANAAVQEGHRLEHYGIRAPRPRPAPSSKSSPARL